jgi:hypothetical protein
MFTDPLPSNGRPIVARVCSRGNVITESLSSNGYTRNNLYSCTFRVWIYGMYNCTRMTTGTYITGEQLFLFCDRMRINPIDLTPQDKSKITRTERCVKCQSIIRNN